MGLVALLVLPLAACRSDGATANTPSAALLTPQTPPRFRRIDREIRRGLAEAARGEEAALRARGPDIGNEGLALLRAGLPHDVARTDVPRYLEGRAVFGEALERWVVAVESGDRAALFAAIRRLDAANRGWIDAYLGLAPETSV
jgi:hypothetical protein